MATFRILDPKTLEVRTVEVKSSPAMKRVLFGPWTPEAERYWLHGDRPAEDEPS